MTTTTISFESFGETLTVESVGPVYVAPCCGAQYGSLRDAVRREITSFGRDCDADEDEIDEAVDAAMDELSGSTNESVRVMRASSVDSSQAEIEKVCKSREAAARYIRENTVDGINVSYEAECDYLYIDGDDA